MKFPPWDPPDPTEEQLAQFRPDMRQYDLIEMRHAQRQQLRDALLAEYKAAQPSRANKVETSYDTYTVHKEIGKGGNGFVYQVTNSSGLEFALKLLNPRIATDLRRKRFKNELGFCERNQHKNIITVIDRGILEGALFYVMPRYSASLKDLNRESIEQRRVLPIFSQILDGVEAAHLKNVIHRDLKPENILFDESSETPVIADFGIAHFEEEELCTLVETGESERVANFEYAAPEQCRPGQLVDHRADIFALGLILNEMFTGSLARGTNYKTIVNVAPRYSYLDDLVAKMISSHPSDRPQTIEEIKSQLRAREHEFFAQQRLSESQHKVVQTTDLDDPLITASPKLIDWDWRPSRLTLILSKPVTAEWIIAFQQIGIMTPSLQPENFSFQGNKAFITAGESDVQRIIDYFKEWLLKANAKYERLRREEIARQEEDQRKKLNEEIEINEARARLRKTIKL